MPSGSRGSCLSFDVNGRGSSDPRLSHADSSQLSVYGTSRNSNSVVATAEHCPPQYIRAGLIGNTRRLRHTPTRT